MSWSGLEVPDCPFPWKNEGRDYLFLDWEQAESVTDVLAEREYKSTGHAEPRRLKLKTTRFLSLVVVVAKKGSRRRVKWAGRPRHGL